MSNQNAHSTLQPVVSRPGTLASWTKFHSQEYSMNTKIQDKDLAQIASSGTQDEDLTMMTPHLVDIQEVKKDQADLEEVDKIKKELMTS